MAKARPVAALRHGGNLAEAARLFPAARQPWIDLSTGINPEAYPLPLLEPEVFARLPSPADLARLEDLAAFRYGVLPAMLLASAGTHPVLAALPRLFPPQRVAVLGPTYAEHGRAWRVGGHAVSDVCSLDDLDGQSIVVVVRPNNPTGETIPLDRLTELCGDVAGKDGLVVIDEAFADFLPRAETALALPSLAKTVILRSFGKTYGLAGIRLSFAIGGPELLGRLRAELGPWPISGPTLAIGTTAFFNEDWFDAAKDRLLSRSAWLKGRLHAIGMCVKGSTPFFILADDHRSQALSEHLGRAGIFTRRFDEHPNWLRLGTPAGDSQTLQRVSDALTNFAG